MSRAACDLLRVEHRAIEAPLDRLLVVQGDSDRSAPIEITGEPKSRLPADAHLHVIEGAGHEIQFTGGPLNQALLTLWRSVS